MNIAMSKFANTKVREAFREAGINIRTNNVKSGKCKIIFCECVLITEGKNFEEAVEDFFNKINKAKIEYYNNKSKG